MASGRADVEKTSWFNDAKIGIFIHFGAYAKIGRGEQSLYRDYLDQNAYADLAMAWTAPNFNARQWCETFRDAGAKYAIMTTRHHDGFCLWDTQTTNYCSAKSAAGKDFIAEYAGAAREAGLKVGLYYSLADWRVPAYFAGPEKDPGAFATFVGYVHEQLRELLTRYGKIDMLWFDGDWPWLPSQWRAEEITRAARDLQPDILINDRFGSKKVLRELKAKGADVGREEVHEKLSDFTNSERKFMASSQPWEVDQLSTLTAWGWHEGAPWKSFEMVLGEMLTACSMGGNFVLNVGPKPDGDLPGEFMEIARRLGEWLSINGEAVYGTEKAVTEYLTYGAQTRKGNRLYLIMSLLTTDNALRLPGITTRVVDVEALGAGTNAPLRFHQREDLLTIEGIPSDRYAPVVRVTFDGPIDVADYWRARLWNGDPSLMIDWTRRRHQGKAVTDYRPGHPADDGVTRLSRDDNNGGSR